MCYSKSGVTRLWLFSHLFSFGVLGVIRGVRGVMRGIGGVIRGVRGEMRGSFGVI